MPHDDAVSLFLAYLQDGKDPVNPSLPAVDDPRGYQDELEYAGDFIAKLSKGSAAGAAGPQRDDLDEPERQPAFKNPMGFSKNSVGYRLKVVRSEIVEKDGCTWAYAYDSSGRCVDARYVGLVEGK
jgi:hypothetical protein